MRSDNLKFKDIIWNTLGTVTYAIVSLILAVVVINISGSIEGGIFSFGFSVLAHLTYIVSYFGVRAMHIVDIKYRFSFNDYLRFAIRTALLAVVLGISYIAFRLITGTYNSMKSILLIVLVFHGAIDGFADCFECEYQRINKLYMCGQSLFFRIVSFTIALLVTLYYTNNLLIAEVVALFVEIIAFYFLNIKRSKSLFKVAKMAEENGSSRNLFLEALPLFLVTFLDMCLFSIAKFSIDMSIGDVYSGFFNLLFMPTNAIYLVMTLFMKPILTPLSNAYYNDKNEYNKIILNTFILSLCIAVIFIIGTIIFGNYYLNIVKFVTNGIYDNIGKEIIFNNISIEKLVLFIVILGGCFYTICTPMYFAIIIENKQKYLFFVYTLNVIISIYLSRYFVLRDGLVGVAIGFAISMFLLFFGVLIVKAVTKK